MELRARERTGDAIRALLNLAPKTARRIMASGDDEEITLDHINPGDQLRVRPGDGVPVDGKFPAILERTPYNKDGGVAGSSGYISPPAPAFFVPRGYVVVLQDVRGRYKSGGHWRPL